MIINKSLAKVYSDVAAVQADTDDLQTQIGTAGDGLTAITGSMALEATIGSPAGASVSADILAVKGVVDAIPANPMLDTEDGSSFSSIPDMALDSTVAKEATIGSPAGASVSADILAMKNVVDAITGYALEATIGTPVDTDISTDIANVQTVVDAITGYALEATLGSPAGASMSADIAAIKVDSAAALVDIGDFSAQSNLTSLLAALGIPDVDSKPLYTCLVTDRLDNATYGLEAIKNAITGGVSGENKGTFSYLDDGGEQTVIELTITDRKIIQGAWLDMSNLTKNGTVKCYYKVDGTNYREVSSEAFTVATDSDGWYIDLNMGVSDDFKITYEEAEDEGDARGIPYAIVWQEIE